MPQQRQTEAKTTKASKVSPKEAPTKAQTSKKDAELEATKTNEQEGEGCFSLPDDWEVDCCAIFWLIIFIATLVVFMVGFIAPKWRDDDDVTSSGIWQICAYGHCYNFVGDSRIPSSGHLKATQTFMCFSLLSLLLSIYGHVGWILSPFNPMYRGCAWCGDLLAGVFGAIGVLIYGVWVGHRPEGWAYWCSVYSAVGFFVNGVLVFCNLRSSDESL